MDKKDELKFYKWKIIDTFYSYKKLNLKNINKGYSFKIL